MKIITTALASVLLFLLASCVSDQVISQDEIEKQNRASEVVSGVLFDMDLDTLASYNVRKDGFVVIIFDENVSDKKYTKAVNLLRSNANVKGVRAEQFGVEVCDLPGR